jgi:hypothetical protein
MKKPMIVILLLCLLLTGCPNTTGEEYINPWYTTDTYQIADYSCLIKKAGIPFRILQLADT